MKKQLILWAVIFLFLSPLFVFSEERSILILHSYHEGFKWTDDINRELRAHILNEFDGEMYIEYMDTKRFGISLFPELAEQYSSKYEGINLDLIICSDNNAFNFLKIYRDKLFGPVPIVFCGINNFTENQLDDFPLVTGVTEEIDIAGTIDLILTIQPDTTHIAAITDGTPTGKIHRQSVSDLRPAYKDRVVLDNVAELSLDKLENRISLLPSDSVLLYLSYFTDGQGKTFSVEDGVSAVCNISELPVYSLWDWAVLNGAVGGIVVSGIEQGRIAGEMALDVLDGSIPHDGLSFLRKSPNIPLFDYKAAHRIPGVLDRLPGKVVFVNKPASFYQENQILIWSVITLFIMLIILVLSLSYAATRRRMMAITLREQRNILKNTLDNIPLFVFWKDKEGVLLGGNQPFYDNFVTMKKDKQILLFSDDEKECLREMESRAMREPVLFHEVQLKDIRGKTRDYVISVIPDGDKDSPISHISLIQDISRRKNLEIRLNQSQKLEALGRLAGGIAHDFNNLLTGIVGASELLGKEQITDEEKNEYLTMILESCDQAAGLVKGMLAYARQAPLSFASVSIDELVEGLEAILKRTMDRKVRLTWDIKDKNLFVVGDKSMLQSTLLNLCINASDAMPEGGDLVLEVKKTEPPEMGDLEGFVFEDRPYVNIMVQDSGEGMSAEVQEKLFDPFFTTKEKGRGTGLGLAGVYGCIKSHHGTIIVESTEGLGAVFNIYLPLSINSAESNPILPNAPWET